MTDRFRLIHFKSTMTDGSSIDQSFPPTGLEPAAAPAASDREPRAPETFLSKSIVTQARQDLMHPDPKIRMLAIQCLEKADPSIALPLLQESLTDGKPEVRAQAVHSLVTFSDPSVWEVIRQHAKDEDPRIRVAVLRGLFKQKERIDVNILQLFANDQSPWVRRKLATLLGWAQLDGIFPLLVRLAKDPHARVRQAALHSLMALYPEESEARLLEAMSDADADLRTWAKDVLERSVRTSGKKGRNLHVGN